MVEGSFHTIHELHGTKHAFLVKGWINGDIGYYRNAEKGYGRWYGIDLKTGVAAHSGYGSTLADAVGLVATHHNLFDEIKATDNYLKAVEEYQKLISCAKPLKGFSYPPDPGLYIET